MKEVMSRAIPVELGLSAALGSIHWTKTKSGGDWRLWPCIVSIMSEPEQGKFPVDGLDFEGHKRCHDHHCLQYASIERVIGKDA